MPGRGGSQARLTADPDRIRRQTVTLTEILPFTHTQPKICAGTLLSNINQQRSASRDAIAEWDLNIARVTLLKDRFCVFTSGCQGNGHFACSCHLNV